MISDRPTGSLDHDGIKLNPTASAHASKAKGILVVPGTKYTVSDAGGLILNTGLPGHPYALHWSISVPTTISKTSLGILEIALVFLLELVALNVIF